MAAFVAAPALLGAGVDAAEHAVVCNCPDAVPGRACPMHAAPDARQAGDLSKNDCRVRNACPPSNAALLAIAGVLGIPVAIVTLTHHDPFTLVVAGPVSTRSRGELPDAPPPRL
jgi:hypothetical protein